MLLAGCQTTAMGDGGTGAGVAAPSPAVVAAAPLCGPAAAVLRAFAERMAEMPAAMGLAADGSAFVVLAAPDGAWSLVQIRPDGLACLRAGGTDWGTLEKGPST